MIFLFLWIFCYLLIMFAMCFDNVCWITSSPEWKEIYKNFLPFQFFKIIPIPKNKEGLKYCFKDRILTVLTHPKDIIPAIITSYILALILGGLNAC